MKIMLSACLAGEKCRYDGKSCKNEAAMRLLDNEVLLICPETEGGLGIPRVPCEICGGDGSSVLDGRAMVLNKNGEDRTKEFISGAYKVLEKAKAFKPDKIYLKAKSPSCGVLGIYDGTFGGRLAQGRGVTAEVLIRNGFEVEEI